MLKCSLSLIDMNELVVNKSDMYGHMVRKSDANVFLRGKGVLNCDNVFPRHKEVRSRGRKSLQISIPTW